jgi:hypothetical protein
MRGSRRSDRFQTHRPSTFAPLIKLLKEDERKRAQDLISAHDRAGILLINSLWPDHEIKSYISAGALLLI